MLERIEIEGWVIELDSAATAAAYALLPEPGPEGCECGYCANWVAGRQTLLTPRVRALLDRLSIPHAGEIEVGRVPDPAGHLYMGWYALVGQVLRSTEHFEIEEWSFSFRPGLSYDVAPFLDGPAFELHFLRPAG